MDPNNLREFYTETEEEEEKIGDLKVPLWGFILMIIGGVIILLALGTLVFFLIRTKLRLKDTELELDDVRKVVSKSYLTKKEIETAHKSRSFLEYFANRVDKLLGLRSCSPLSPPDICGSEGTCPRKPASMDVPNPQIITIPQVVRAAAPAPAKLS